MWKRVEINFHAIDDWNLQAISIASVTDSFESAETQHENKKILRVHLNLVSMNASLRLLNRRNAETKRRLGPCREPIDRLHTSLEMKVAFVLGHGDSERLILNII